MLIGSLTSSFRLFDSSDSILDVTPSNEFHFESHKHSHMCTTGTRARGSSEVDSVFYPVAKVEVCRNSFLVGRLVSASPTSHRYVTSRGRAGMQFNDRGIQRTNGRDNCSYDQGFGYSYDPKKIALCKIRTWPIIKNGLLGSENKQKKTVLAKWYLCASYVHM